MAKTLSSLVSAVSHFSVSSMLKKLRFVSLVYCSTVDNSITSLISQRCLILNFFQFSVGLLLYLPQSLYLFFHACIFILQFKHSASQFIHCRIQTDMRSALDGENVLSHCSLTLLLSDKPELLAFPSFLSTAAASTNSCPVTETSNRTDGLTSMFTHPFCLDFFFALDMLAVSSVISMWELSWLDTDWLHWACLTLRRFSPLSKSYSIAGWQCRHFWWVVQFFSNLHLVTVLGWRRVSGATFQLLFSPN